MSIFANPASAAGDAARAYTTALLDVLGDRDPMAVWKEHADAISSTIAGVSDADARRPERPGKWSIIQVLGHLVDTEVVYGYRMRMIVAHDTPDIQGYDQDRWASLLRYDEEDVESVLGDLRRFRARNLRFVERLRDAELDRVGMHSERGPESVRRNVQLIAGHDLVHRAQLARIVRSLGLPG